MKGLLARKLTMLLLVSLSIAVLTYAVDLWLIADPLARVSLSPKDALFLEGLICVLLGALLILGSGGINLWTVKAAILQSATDAITGESGEPSKVFKRDAWKPGGFIRLALVLVFSGVFMILSYSL
jgi:hypothetical protein